MEIAESLLSNRRKLMAFLAASGRARVPEAEAPWAGTSLGWSSRMWRASKMLPVVLTPVAFSLL
jgi:hypothetical protein